MTTERPTEPPSACQNIDQAITLLKGVLFLNSDLDYEAILLWAAHSRMRGILPSRVCLYLAFDGPKSSGKTTATEAAIRISHNGKMITSTTPAALKRTLDGGATVGLDEIDAQTMKNEPLETLLRVGNSWNATAQLCQSTGKDWTVIETNVGGPKVFNFRGDIDDALRSRCLIIGMPSKKDHNLAIDTLFMDDDLKIIGDWLDFEVSQALKQLEIDAASLSYTSQAWVQAEMQSQAFRELLKGIKPELGRNLQQAAILLIINKILDWKLDTPIKEIIEGQVNEDPFESEKEIIADIFLRKKKDNHQSGLDTDGPITISSQELWMIVNKELKDKARKEMSKSQFATLKRELGWQEGVNANKLSKAKGKIILTFDDRVLKNLDLERADKPEKREEYLSQDVGDFM
jgi:hypothetical protein